MSSTRRRWSEPEDDALRAFVSLYGEKAWQQVCKFIPGRSAKQCYERWRIYLSPNIRKNEFSKDEDELLKTLVERMGKQWSKIARLFDGRAPETLKNRYKTITRREQNEKKRVAKLEEARQAFAKELADAIFQKFENVDLTKE